MNDYRRRARGCLVAVVACFLIIAIVVAAWRWVYAEERMGPTPICMVCPTQAEQCPENGQRMATEEFERRMRLTLAFLRENNRPYWAHVVAEQEAFLESLKDHGARGAPHGERR